MPLDALGEDIRFLNAETLGDVYGCTEFPHILAQLTKPQAFSDFYNETGPPNMGCWQETGGRIRPYERGTGESLSRFDHFKEAAEIIFAHQNSLIGTKLDRRMQIKSWHVQFQALMTGRVGDAKSDPIPPRILASLIDADTLVNVVVSAGGDTGKIVPHDHTHKVLSESPFSHLLGRRLFPTEGGDEPLWGKPGHWFMVLQDILNPNDKLDGRIFARCVETRDALLAGAIPVPENAVVRMSAITVYELPPTPPERQVCLRAYTTYRTAPGLVQHPA